MNVETLKRCQADPAVFRSHLLIDGQHGPVRLSESTDDWQREDFTALDPALRRVAGQQTAPRHTRAWLERPRGHSKTSDLAVMVVFILFASSRMVAGIAAAADLDQAKLLRTAVERLVQLNPWLAEFIDPQRDCIRNPHTGSELRIISSDAATSFGLTPDFVICDELTHWKSRGLWDSLISSAAKRANCCVVVITNAGHGDTWQWQTREAVTTDPNWYFNALPGPVASWITPARLAEQQRLLPAIAYARLWLNQWTNGSGDAIADADLRAALTCTGPLSAPEPGYRYIAGLDLGLSRDASALVILGRNVGWTERKRLPEVRRPAVTRALIDLGIISTPVATQEYESIHHEATGRYRVAQVHLWRPLKGQRVSIEAIEETLIALNAQFNLACVAYDPWQCEFLSERLRKARVPCEPVPFVPGNLQSMATATLEAFGERIIDLHPDDNLLSDLRKLQIEEKSYGVRLSSPRGPSGHGDSATALAIALHSAKRFAYRAPSEYRGRLVCYPC